MKRLVLLCFCLLAGLTMYGQLGPGLRINKQLEVALPEALTQIQMEWVALDADTLIDLVVVGVASDGTVRVMTFRNKVTALEWKKTQATQLLSAYVQPADLDGDNQIDLLISGKVLLHNGGLFFFKSNGDFTFTVSKIIDRDTPFRVADFTNDGKPDLLTYDSLPNASIAVLRRDSLGYSFSFNSAQMLIHDVAVSDFNNDGKLDFVVSGKDNLNNPFTTLFSATEKNEFIPHVMSGPVKGLLSAFDKNGDGWTDLVGTGKTTTGLRQQTWTNDGTGTLIPEGAMTAGAKESLFTADMNADGAVDVVTSSKQPIRSIQIDLGTSVKSLLLPNMITQKEGDYDGDGDLDIAIVKDSLSLQWIDVLALEADEKNNKPSLPVDPFAISTDRKTFLVWESAGDDHTPTSSLTYDVWLGSSRTLLAPNFQLSTAARMVVAQGNAGTLQSKIITNLKDGQYDYLIQTVDNAYRGSAFAKGRGLLCFNLAHQDVNVCKGQTVTLNGTETAYWFSTQSGFIQKSTTIKFVASKNDTIYSFVPQSADCGKNRVYRMHVYDASSQSTTRFACEGATIKLNVNPGWQTVQWDTDPPIANSNSIQVTMAGSKVVTATATSGPGCTYKQIFQLRPSTPKLGLNGNTFRLRKGTSVQLEASGVFSTFSWTPVAGLSNPNIGNPVAEPIESTTYRVTATDSIGCAASATVQVLVEFTAFVPNLFTPNDDNKNDALLIYGLGQTSGFLFQVFNRDGSLVFETADPFAAGQTGWNGFVNGTRQPPGVYYWKVEGHTDTGDPLLLNGKKTGSVLLVH
ncbi:MAG TPA: gliding motility-associated C-terminal domain-containing protein [Cyclobacteriaceae bacterium]|nr:gliding motility-associated C-terminal domain-containing protein [Cyclobacteriaceae bacterium]